MVSDDIFSRIHMDFLLQTDEKTMPVKCRKTGNVLRTTKRKKYDKNNIPSKLHYVNIHLKLHVSAVCG